jgi:tetratricopeptide (TPR) repeat protein
VTEPLAAVERSPADSAAWEALGDVYRAQGDVRRAALAYRRATESNPARLASWQALVELEGQTGGRHAAEQASRAVAGLARLPPVLLKASIDLHDGRLARAERACREHLRDHPRDVEGMRILAGIGLKLGILDDAEFLLESCLFFAPDHRAARYEYIRVLHKRQRFAKALEQSRRLLDTDPHHPLYRSVHAAAMLAVGDFDSALAVYDALVAEDPGDPVKFLHRGHALKTVGRTQDAVASYRRAATIRPDLGDAYWSLANLKTYRFPDAEFDRMREAEAAEGTSQEDRYHLCFALGKACEQRGDFDGSFAFYERGNRLKRGELRYRHDRLLQEMRLQQEVFTPQSLSRSGKVGCPAPDPIFIVGLPRAGSTLLEQILASHPLVDGTLELPNVLAIANRLNGRGTVDAPPRYPAVVAGLPDDVFGKLGQEYLDETRLHRRGAPRFTDKMPNNFRHIGLISLMLPGAKIIDARRDPMACCFSAYQQLFAEGQEFSYDLTDLGQYYRAYVELMDHWDRVLPGRILRVHHEHVVADLEHEVRRLLDFVGLPFDERCLRFHETDRPVRTASSEQVRQPLNTRGVEQWRRYAAHLGPLRAALGDLATGGA